MRFFEQLKNFPNAVTPPESAPILILPTKNDNDGGGGAFSVQLGG
jgi:hypothetical protein